jgi:hypothetical protein
MKRFKSFLLPMIMVGILVLSGCETYGPRVKYDPNATLGSSFQQAEKIPAGKAVVYIYRPIGADGKVPFGVKANGNVVTTLMQGGYYAYFTEPSQIEFTAFEIGFMAPTSTFSITVDAKAGQAYYLKGAHGKGLGGRANLVLVSPEVGAQEIANCQLISSP